MDFTKKERNNSLIFNIFDGKNFREWKELMILFLMGCGLWNLVNRSLESESEEFKAEVATREGTLEFQEKKQKAYAILSLNLSSSCRDCIRALDGTDPAAAWEAIVRKFEGKTPLDNLLALDELLAFTLSCDDIPGSISKFRQIIEHLKGLNIELDEHLYIALLLRNLPEKFNPLATNLRHREEITFDIAIDAIESEAKAFDVKPDNQTMGQSTSSEVLVVTNDFCQHCKKPGHTKRGCWKLHPNLAPFCDFCGGKGHWGTNCRKKSESIGHSNCVTFDQERPYVL